jgi:hypothetical protein
MPGNNFDGFNVQRIGKRPRCPGDVTFNGMRQCIHAGGRF